MSDNDRIQLAHGGGGQLTAELIETVILPALSGQTAGELTDAAVLAGDGRIAFTTDSYVVQPLEFPGGDIGKLAVCGTINDLAVSGARPVALSLSLILQEGLEMALLERVLASAGRAAKEAGVNVVTGDTKVVERDALDGIVINTSGVGAMLPSASLGFDRIRPGDAIVLSGPLGEHGLAVMSQRKGLTFATELQSDCAALHELTTSLIERLADGVRLMRDPTRGGLATVVVEIGRACGCDVEIDELALPTSSVVAGAADMLGLDVLTVANEGKLVAFVAPETAEEAVAVLREHAIAASAAVVGHVGEQSDSPLVEMVTAIGGRRIVQMPYGEELPRIC
ncbi:MAG: hydrogenase expression/formation protein HypE [Planctomycetota bacterium]|jgi:hydrogenase expression/formation protein HypE